MALTAQHVYIRVRKREDTRSNSCSIFFSIGAICSRDKSTSLLSRCLTSVSSQNSSALTSLTRENAGCTENDVLSFLGRAAAGFFCTTYAFLIMSGYVKERRRPSLAVYEVTFLD